MKFIFASLFFIFIQNSAIAIESDSIQHTKLEHHFGLEALGKQTFHSLYYELEKTSKNPKHHFGLGYGISTRRFKSPNARYISNCLHVYYSFGQKNQIRTSLAYDIGVNVTNIKMPDPSEADGKRSDLIQTPSISIGYLRKSKNNNLSYGLNVLGMMSFYDYHLIPELTEKRNEFYMNIGIFVHYNIF